MKVMVWFAVSSRHRIGGLLKKGVLCVREEEWALVCSTGCTCNCTGCGAEEGEGRAGFVRLGALE